MLCNVYLALTWSLWFNVSESAFWRAVKEASNSNNCEAISSSCFLCSKRILFISAVYKQNRYKYILWVFHFSNILFCTFGIKKWVWISPVALVFYGILRFDVLDVSIYVAVPLLLVHLSWDLEWLWDLLRNWYSSGGFYDRTVKRRKIIKYFWVIFIN